MTEEENKAIECLKIVVDDINECGAEYYIDKDILSDIQIALNLTEKLQKENEELRHSYDIATTKTEELKKKLGLKQFDVNVVYNDYLEKLREFKSNSIPKDKVRELLKKSACEEKYDFHCAYEKLFEDFEELLEED